MLAFFFYYYFFYFRGVLTGKYKRGEKLDPVSGRIAHIAKDETKAMQSAPAWSKYANDESYWNLLDVMEQIGKRHGNKYFTCLTCFKIFLKIMLNSFIVRHVSTCSLNENIVYQI